MNISEKQLLISIQPTDNAIDNILLINKNNLLVSFKNYGYIYIYNLITFEIISKIEFPNKNKSITYNILLKDKRLAHSSHDNNIYITKKLDNDQYIINEILNEHKDKILKVIELKNEQICSCSIDQTIKVWEKNNNKKFFLKYNLKDLKEEFYSIIEISDNIIISTSEKDNSHVINFWKINEKKVFNSITNNNICLWNNNCIKIEENVLAITGKNKILIIIYDNEKTKTIKNFDINGIFFSIYRIKNNNFLIGDLDGNIYEIKYQNKEFTLIAAKKNIHIDLITCFCELNNGTLISSSNDKILKIFI